MRKVMAVLTVLFLLGLSGVALGHHKDGHSGGNKCVEVVGDDTHDNRHPSGKDRETCDGPGDDEQGHSPSDPDDDGRGPDRSNGGADKRGGTGGVDKDDQDGNNGCGNDDDFEDDNEGWCGGKPKPRPTTHPTVHPSGSPTPPKPSPTVGETPSPVPTATPSVDKTNSPSPAPTDSVASPSPRESEAGESPVPGAPLANTGADEKMLGTWVLTALALIFVGVLLWSLWDNNRKF